MLPLLLETLKKYLILIKYQILEKIVRGEITVRWKCSSREDPAKNRTKKFVACSVNAYSWPPYIPKRRDTIISSPCRTRILSREVGNGGSSQLEMPVTEMELPSQISTNLQRINLFFRLEILFAGDYYSFRLSWFPLRTFREPSATILCVQYLSLSFSVIFLSNLILIHRDWDL